MSTSTRPAGPGRRLPTVQLPERLAEVIQLHTPTVAEPTEVDQAGDQLALPLFFLIDGEGGGE